MIRSLGLVLVFAVYSCSLLQAGEPEIKAKIEALKAVAREESSGKEGTDGRPNLVAYVGALETLFAQKDYLQMQESLRSGMSYFIKSDKAVAAAQELGVLLTAAVQEQKDRSQKEIDALLSEQGKVLMAAKTPKEVDPVLAALQKVQTQMGSMSGRRYYDGNSLESAVRVAANWQDFLRNRQNGNITEAQNQLRQIQENLTRIPQFVPRSVVGEMMDQLGSKSAERQPFPVANDEAFRKACELLVSGKSAADIPRVYEGIKDLSWDRNDRNYISVVPQITRLNLAYQAFKSGDLDTTLAQLRRQDGDAQEITFLRNTLIMETLPVYMEKPGFKVLKDESVGSVIDRMVQESVKKNEWSAVYRGLHAYRAFSSTSYSGNSQPGLNDDIQAVGNLISGYNYERAEQWSSAVRHYLAALQVAKEVDIVPFVGKRLKEIEAAHPEDYKVGMAPPESTYNRANFPYTPGSSASSRPSPTTRSGYLPPGPLDAKTKEPEAVGKTTEKAAEKATEKP